MVYQVMVAEPGCELLLPVSKTAKVTSKKSNAEKREGGKFL
jgi:hypothetical protein